MATALSSEVLESLGFRCEDSRLSQIMGFEIENVWKRDDVVLAHWCISQDGLPDQFYFIPNDRKKDRIEVVSVEGLNYLLKIWKSAK